MTLNLVQGRSLAAMPDQGDKAEEPATATSCERRPVPKNLKKKDPASRSGKRRPFPVDAATAPAAINVEDGAAGIRRQLPPVDAAAEGDIEEGGILVTSPSMWMTIYQMLERYPGIDG